MVKAKTRQSTVTAAPPIPIRGIAVVVSPNRNGLLLGYISNSILTPMVPRASPSAPLMNERTMLSVSNWRRMRLRPAPSAVLIAISRVLRSARTSRRFATLTQAMSNRRPTAARRRFSDDRTLPTIASWSGSTLHTVRALMLPGASRREAATATASWAFAAARVVKTTKNPSAANFWTSAPPTPQRIAAGRSLSSSSTPWTLWPKRSAIGPQTNEHPQPRRKSANNRPP